MQRHHSDMILVGNPLDVGIEVGRVPIAEQTSDGTDGHVWQGDARPNAGSDHEPFPKRRAISVHFATFFSPVALGKEAFLYKPRDDPKTRRSASSPVREWLIGNRSGKLRGRGVATALDRRVDPLYSRAL